MLKNFADQFATPGGPRQPTPDQLQHYQLVPYQCAMTNSSFISRTKDQEFKAAGDFLTPILISGPDILGVSIGAKDNPFIPLREGMAIGPRPFDSFRVRQMSSRKQDFPRSPETVALFGVSYGPLITDPGFKRHLFEPGAFTVTTDVDNTPTDLLDPANIRTRWGLPVNGAVPSMLRWGGTLRIHNRDGALPVFVFFGRPGVSDPNVLPIIGVNSTLDQVAWQIDPGQKEEFIFESGILWNAKTGDEINDQSFNLSLFAQTAGGTVRVAVLFGSAIRDLTDADVLSNLEPAESLGGT
jgi:hypothetical protein